MLKNIAETSRNKHIGIADRRVKTALFLTMALLQERSIQTTSDDYWQERENILEKSATNDPASKNPKADSTKTQRRTFAKQ